WTWGGASESLNRTTILHSDKCETQNQCARRSTSEIRGWRCGFMRRIGCDEAEIGGEVARRRGARRAALAEMKSVHYPSSDGLDIPAFLTLPRGTPPKALPLVIMPHGGPWARVTWGYDAW